MISISLTIKTGRLHFQDADGNEKTVNIIAEESTEQMLANIESAGSSAIETIATAKTTAVEIIQDKSDDVKADLDTRYPHFGDLSLEFKDVKEATEEAVESIREHLVTVSREEPISDDSRLWVGEATEEVEVLTPEDAEAINAAIALKADMAELTSTKTALEGNISTLDGRIAVAESDITGVQNRLDNIDEVIIGTVDPLQKQADDTQRSLEMLWKLNKGQTYDIEQKSESGMNAAPSGAKWMTMEEVEGKTEQESTNGYQLLNESEFFAQAVAMGNTTISSRAGKIEGTVVVSAFNNGGVFTPNIMPLNVGDIYTISADITISQSVTCNVLLGNEDVNPSQVAFVANTKHRVTLKNKTVSSKTIVCYLAPYSNFNGTITVENIMVERGDTAHDYEPYTGGIPSPNPDYPQEIVSVDNFTVKVTGKNLLNPNMVNTIWWESSGVGAVGHFQPYKETFKAIVPIINVSKISKVWFMGNLAPITSSAVRLLVSKEYPTVGGEYLRLPNIDASNMSAEIPSGYNYLVALCYSAGGDMIYTDDYKWMFSSEPIAEYEPYTETIRTITPPHPLNKIGEYVDKAMVDDGVWEYAIRKYAVQASSLTKSGSGRYWYYTALVTPIAYLDTANFLCNYFVAGHWNYNKGICFGNSSSRVVGISTQIFATAEEAVEFLNSHDVYALIPYETVQTVPIDPDDLAFLRSLELLPADKHITVYDNHGRYVSYLLEYITKLDEVN